MCQGLSLPRGTKVTNTEKIPLGFESELPFTINISSGSLQLPELTWALSSTKISKLTANGMWEAGEKPQPPSALCTYAFRTSPITAVLRGSSREHLKVLYLSWSKRKLNP